MDNLVERNAAPLAKEPWCWFPAAFSEDRHWKAGCQRLEEVWAKWDHDYYHWSDVVGQTQSQWWVMGKGCSWCGSLPKHLFKQQEQAQRKRRRHAPRPRCKENKVVEVSRFVFLILLILISLPVPLYLILSADDILIYIIIIYVFLVRNWFI